uniref:hypothetical protein n=1 Tax=Synechococcus sp. UW106 TaxID=368495 RepID=UPI0010BD9B28|nr:hypothetical protein [Synechococcus sp. UW106]
MRQWCEYRGKPIKKANKNHIKNFTLPFLAGVAGAFVALGVAISTPPKAEAGGIYWNNNGGGGVLFDAADHCPA